MGATGPDGRYRRWQTTNKLSKRQLEEMARRGVAATSADRSAVVSQLREKARHEYLAERQDKKLLELEDDIRDEEFLFRNQKLTDVERRRLDEKKRMLQLAREHQRLVGGLCAGKRAARLVAPHHARRRAASRPR